MELLGYFLNVTFTIVVFCSSNLDMISQTPDKHKTLKDDGQDWKFWCGKDREWKEKKVKQTNNLLTTYLDRYIYSPPSVSCHTIPSNVTLVPGSQGPRQSGSVMVPTLVPIQTSIRSWNFKTHHVLYLCTAQRRYDGHVPAVKRSQLLFTNLQFQSLSFQHCSQTKLLVASANYGDNC